MHARPRRAGETAVSMTLSLARTRAKRARRARGPYRPRAAADTMITRKQCLNDEECKLRDRECASDAPEDALVNHRYCVREKTKKKLVHANIWYLSGIFPV